MREAIDLNCDMGERPDLIADGTEEALMESISSANVACGAHAGDEASMEATIRAALRHRLAVGAHPGFPDREHFGRRDLALTAKEIARTVEDQILTLLRVAGRCGASIGHVKPHGALYNLAARNAAVARAIADGVRRAAAGGSGGLGREIALMGLSGSSMIGVFAEAGFRVAGEAFADRRYEPDGSLRPRRFPDALITDPAAAAAQTLGIVRDGEVAASDGRRVPVRAETISIHADTPGAAAIARAVAARLREAGIEVRPIGRPPLTRRPRPD